jgi:hypothetical protein
MTPTEIIAHADEINSFKAYMLEDFGKLANQIAKELKESVDERHISYSRRKLQLTEAYIQIMLDYLESTVEGDENFFTVEEFYDTVRQLNRLLNNYYWLDLS